MLHFIEISPSIANSGAKKSGSACPSVYMTTTSTVPLGPRVRRGASLMLRSWTQAVAGVELKAPSLTTKETCLSLLVTGKY